MHRTVPDKEKEHYAKDIDHFFVDRLLYRDQKEELEHKLTTIEEKDATNKAKDGGEGIHLVCVNGSKASDDALQFALRNTPKSHSLLVAFGLAFPVLPLSSSGSGAPISDDSTTDDELASAHEKYQHMCKEAGVRHPSHAPVFHISHLLSLMDCLGDMCVCMGPASLEELPVQVFYVLDSGGLWQCHLLSC